MVMQLGDCGSLYILIVTIRFFCRCVIFNTKNLYSSRVIQLSIKLVSHVPRRLLVLKIAQLKPRGAKIVQLKARGSKMHNHDT